MTTFETEMNSGRPIVDNAGHLYVIGEMEPDGDKCPDCDGDGAWTWTVEGPGGRDVDVDSECHRCDGTGWTP